MPIMLSMLTQTVTLTDQVAGKLAADIGAGQYPVGTKLPAGRLLAEQYGVSAAVIREATERLRALGLVQSRQGSGCMVTARRVDSGFQVPARISVDHQQLASVYELRMELEGGAAALAAVRRNDDDLAAMATALNDLAQHLEDPERGVDHDIDFHVAVARATHNTYYQQLLQYLNQQLRQAVQTARSHTLLQRGLSKAVHQEHVAIFAAIQAGDAKRARAAATQHLQGAAARLQLNLPFSDVRPTL